MASLRATRKSEARSDAALVAARRTSMLRKLGSAIDARMPMMAMTTSNSTKVMPFCFRMEGECPVEGLHIVLPADKWL